MSNYIFGYIKGAEKPLSFYVDAIRARSVLGFHDVAAPPPEGEFGFRLPIGSAELPIPEGCEMTFCVSDSQKTLGAEYLIDESQWSDEEDTILPKHLPLKLHDRLVLIVEQVRTIFEETQCEEVGLWPSVTDLLEGVTDVSLSLFLDRLEVDFEKRGIPCCFIKLPLCQ